MQVGALAPGAANPFAGCLTTPSLCPPLPYDCPNCPARFGSASGRARHAAAHACADAPRLCLLHARSFPDARAFAAHVGAHAAVLGAGDLRLPGELDTRRSEAAAQRLRRQGEQRAARRAAEEGRRHRVAAAAAGRGVQDAGDGVGSGGVAPPMSGVAAGVSPPPPPRVAGDAPRALVAASRDPAVGAAPGGARGGGGGGGGGGGAAGDGRSKPARPMAVLAQRRGGGPAAAPATAPASRVPVGAGAQPAAASDAAKAPASLRPSAAAAVPAQQPPTAAAPTKPHAAAAAAPSGVAALAPARAAPAPGALRAPAAPCAYQAPEPRPSGLSHAPEPVSSELCLSLPRTYIHVDDYDLGGVAVPAPILEPATPAFACVRGFALLVAGGAKRPAAPAAAALGPASDSETDVSPPRAAAGA